MKIPKVIGISAVLILIVLPVTLVSYVSLSAKPAEFRWQRFVSEDGDFWVDFPGRVKQKKMEVPYPNGSIAITTVSSVIAPERLRELESFTVSYFDAPEVVRKGKGEAELLLIMASESSLNRAMHKFKTGLRISAIRDIHLGELRGKEIVFESPKFLFFPKKVSGIKRVYIKENKVYQTQIILSPRLNFRAKLDSATSERFFNSFQLIDLTQKQATLKNKLPDDV